MRASQGRLVLSVDADRRRIERDLHDGLQQRLVALAVNLQLARQLADDDSVAAKALLEEMGREVHRALDEAARLAHRIYPPLLEAGGLAVALRTAAASVGIPTRIEVAADCPPEVAGTVYFCCLEVLERAGDGARATITVRDEKGALGFEVVADGASAAAAASDEILSRWCERVEALVAEKARGEQSPLNSLTARERDVLREMAEGKNNAAIADALFLTERSVEKVIHSIFLKLGLTWETAVHKRVKAVILYLAESG